jgi:hypothetical protein
MELRVMAVVTAAITAERLAPAGERVARAAGLKCRSRTQSFKISLSFCKPGRWRAELMTDDSTARLPVSWYASRTLSPVPVVAAMMQRPA